MTRESKHVDHDMRVSITGKGITVGQFKRTIKALRIPDDAVIRFSGKTPSGWQILESMSYCRDVNEISMW